MPDCLHSVYCLMVWWLKGFPLVALESNEKKLKKKSAAAVIWTYISLSRIRYNFANLYKFVFGRYAGNKSYESGILRVSLGKVHLPSHSLLLDFVGYSRKLQISKQNDPRTGKRKKTKAFIVQQMCRNLFCSTLFFRVPHFVRIFISCRS